MHCACSATYLGYSGQVGNRDWCSASREPPNSLALTLPLIGRIGPSLDTTPVVFDEWVPALLKEKPMRLSSVRRKGSKKGCSVTQSSRSGETIFAFR